VHSSTNFVSSHKPVLCRCASQFSLPQVNLVFHIIHPTDKRYGYLPLSAVNRQVDILNSAFRGDECNSVGRPCVGVVDSNIRFKLHRVVYRADDYWSIPGQVKQLKNEVAYELTKNFNSKEYLNIVVCDTAATLGWTQYPWVDNEGAGRQAVFVNYRTLPGVQPGMEPCSYACKYNVGYTTVHEVGHYFGLFHTFTKDSSCYTQQDDGIDDTPMQKTPGRSTVYADSCTMHAGYDPTWSFLDYADDEIMQQFSAGQVERMQLGLHEWRPALLANSGGGAFAGFDPTSPAPLDPCVGRTRQNFCNGAADPTPIGQGGASCGCGTCDLPSRGSRCQDTCKNAVCEAGFFRRGLCSMTINAYFCEACVQGQYNPAKDGSTSCYTNTIYLCPKGHRMQWKNSMVKERICTECEQGTYQPNAAAMSSCLNQPTLSCSSNQIIMNLDSKIYRASCTSSSGANTCTEQPCRVQETRGVRPL
jgi:predicted Zn-dependent protease